MPVCRQGLVKEELDLNEWVERRIPKRGAGSRRQRGRSLTPDAPLQKKSSLKTRQAKSAERSLKRRKKRKDGLRSDDASSSRRKKKKAKSDKLIKKKKAAKAASASRSDDSSGNNDPEEGGITESEGEWKSTSSSPPPTKYSSESEIDSQEGERRGRTQFRVIQPVSFLCTFRWGFFKGEGKMKQKSNIT